MENVFRNLVCTTGVFKLDLWFSKSDLVQDNLCLDLNSNLSKQPALTSSKSMRDGNPWMVTSIRRSLLLGAIWLAIRQSLAMQPAKIFKRLRQGRESSCVNLWGITCVQMEWKRNVQLPATGNRRGLGLVLLVCWLLQQLLHFK